MDLCKYRDMFGKPNTGMHSIRIGNIAVADTLLTVLLAYAIAGAFNVSFYETLIVLFIVGVVCHRVFCVRTTVDKMLFG